MKKSIVAMFLAGLTGAAVLAGCSTPEEKAARAQQEVSEAELELKKERLALLDDYKKCLETAGGDRAKAEECDRILKAVEALK